MGLLEVGLDLCWVWFGLSFVEQTRNAQTDPAGTLNKSDWHKSGRTSPRKFPMEYLGKSYRVDPYSPAKITENRARLEFRTCLAPVGSDIVTVSPDEILRQDEPRSINGMEVKFECDLGRLEDILVQVCRRRQEAMERAAMGVTAALGHAVGPTCFEDGLGQSLGLD
ncbi:hypothetical protein CRG98_036782 [Punica granatum]|uniref:Uncharacterized protein n=1 Tax=Punica granatum TaxID=22663 RepID=A0A2I0IFQ2_PUNGR|nr:hypothetical protein CRG98_036782 [Punica granatum]